MPLYEYKCEKCGYKDELLLKVNPLSIKICPECNKKSFKKQMTAPHVYFKGSGWTPQFHGMVNGGEE